VKFVSAPPHCRTPVPPISFPPPSVPRSFFVQKLPELEARTRLGSSPPDFSDIIGRKS